MNVLTTKSLQFDIANFTIREMTVCGKILRAIGNGAASMEEVAGKIVGHFYDSLIDGRTGSQACSLVRFYKTHFCENLDPELQGFAKGLMGDNPVMPRMKCLVLLATSGENPQWKSRKISKGHRAIPLPSEEAVRQAPMISNLIRQMGLDVSVVVRPDPKLLLDIEQKTFNVFYVPEALGSPYIPAQKDFVIPYGIKSVIGFGGLLPAGDMFAVIIFFKVAISPEVAELFKPLSLNVKMAVLPFEKAVFPD